MKASHVLYISFITIIMVTSCISNKNGIIVPAPPQTSSTSDRSETPETKNEMQGTIENSPDQHLTPLAEGRPDPQNKEELTVVFSSGSVEFDPRKSFLASEAQLFTALYEGLFSYNPLTLEPIPAVAESWKLSDDKKTWTFTLRSTARYWNGDKLTSQHFRDAWISLLDPAGNNPYSSLFDIIVGAKEYRTGQNKDSKEVGIECPDEKTLIVHLNAPAAFFPSMLCHHSFSPIHPNMIGITDWSKQVPISNGPYYLVEQHKDRLVLAKNELYWDSKRVALKKLIIRFTQDGEEAASLWNSGEARWIAGDVNLEALQDRSGIVVNAMFATYYFYIRSSRSPWNDSRVRQALSLTLPWDAIRQGYYLPAETLIYPIPGYPKPKGLTETNLEKAQQLLKEAGFPKGVGMPTLVIKISQSKEAYRIASIMASAWKDGLGVPVDIKVTSYDSYLDELKKDDYVVGSSTWIGDFADPYTFLQMWRWDSNLNDARFHDPVYENLIDQSMKEEGEVRWQTLSRAEEQLLQGGTVLPIAYTPALNIIDMNEIDGWYPNPLDIHPFKYLVYATFRALPGVAWGPIHQNNNL
ncbi:peptide ABC transporter substrate-binding protein [Gracilinema caldarium]|uniref:ABC-type transporter, periplasmic subunit n=1 Tax=Gracilinema caldarium (strain ATCC 51460 / DSM 7334 / H1) TaxID=744872 RepID=F8F0U4_GRAC1|nr:peptide ABC transporter substrate-binding protein [Gracilinema caldarium]AEJ20230.1 ABC-type transporter, periplasmic subunit [Gracilinema caldarium DSM 7334]